MSRGGLASDGASQHATHDTSDNTPHDTAFDTVIDIVFGALLQGLGLGRQERDVGRGRCGFMLLEAIRLLGSGLRLDGGGLLRALGGAPRDEAHGEKGTSPAGQTAQAVLGHVGSAFEGINLERTSPPFGLRA
jgi:hypothetical protein